MKSCSVANAFPFAYIRSERCCVEVIAAASPFSILSPGFWLKRITDQELRSIAIFLRTTTREESKVVSSVSDHSNFNKEFKETDIAEIKKQKKCIRNKHI